jgi:hypothetical protein
MASSNRPKGYQTLLADLKRRHVFKVAAAYGATAFVLLEVADLVFPRLGLPDWSITFVVALVIIGFPVALILAWAFELTPQGVHRAEPASSGELQAIVAQPRKSRWPAGLLALAGTALLLTGIWFVGGRQLAESARQVERAYAERSATLALHNWYRWVLRSDPTYNQVLHRMGLAAPGGAP